MRVLGPVGAAFRKTRRRLVAAGHMVARRLDPKAWILHGWHADLFSTFAFIVAGTAGLATLTPLDAASITVSMPPMAYILFVLVRKYRAGAAQRDEEADEIDDAYSLVHQCSASLELIVASLSEFPEDYRTYLALGWLSSEVRLLVTRYRRYLTPEAVWAVLEAEGLILKASLSRSRGLDTHMGAIGRRLETIGGGIIDIDAPRLRARRGRV